jgi:hypothetical protein
LAIGAIVSVIIGFLISTTGIIIGQDLSTGLLLGNAGESSDREQIDKVATLARQKCSDAQSPQPTGIPSGTEVQLRSVERLSYNSGKLVAKKGENTYTWDMDAVKGCTYNFQVHGKGSMPITDDMSNIWSFKISVEDKSGHTILVNASRK